jgi:hypothetical protein
VLGALPPLPAAQPQKADGEARQHANWFLPALIWLRMVRRTARSMVRPLGMERRVARGVVEFWCWRGGCWSELQMVDRADKISRAR